jgi:hypothetical protein
MIFIHLKLNIRVKIGLGYSVNFYPAVAKQKVNEVPKNHLFIGQCSIYHRWYTLESEDDS